jgi:hypothetical protein
LCAQYGVAFYNDFAARSAKILHEVISKTPDIGSTLFSFNYAFTPAYIAWYKAACALNINEKEIQDLLWLLNERIITVVPRFCMKAFVKAYLKNFRKKAPLHEKRMADGTVHPYDYRIKFRDVNKTTFEIDITRCGMMSLARDLDALGIFPAVCRVDYMLFSYMGAGFKRTKTLGDGDDHCNCRYIIGGACEWATEKGFEGRK